MLSPIHSNKQVLVKMNMKLCSCIFLLLNPSFTTCENGDIVPNIIWCTEVESSNAFTQSYFSIRKNKDLASTVTFNKASTERCRLDTNHSLHIELERLSRVSSVGIHKDVIRSAQSKLSVIVVRDDSDDKTKNIPCSFYLMNSDWAYFSCTSNNVHHSYVNAVKIMLKSGSESLDLKLKLKNPTTTWMFLIDNSCENRKHYKEGDLPDCIPKTCRRPMSISKGQWYYLDDQSFTKIQYSCHDPFEKRYESVDDAKKGGMATCNAAKNNWEGVPTCEIREMRTDAVTVARSTPFNIVTSTWSSQTSPGPTVAYLTSLSSFSVMSFSLGILTGFLLLVIVNLIAFFVYSKWTRRNQNAEPLRANIRNYRERVVRFSNRPSQIYENPFYNLPDASDEDWELSVTIGQLCDEPDSLQKGNAR